MEIDAAVERAIINVKSLTKTQGWTAIEAMNALEISEDKQKQILAEIS